MTLVIVLELKPWRKISMKIEMMNSRNVEKRMQQVRCVRWKGIRDVVLDIGSNRDTAQLDVRNGKGTHSLQCQGDIFYNWNGRPAALYQQLQVQGGNTAGWMGENCWETVGRWGKNMTWWVVLKNVSLAACNHRIMDARGRLLSTKEA